MSRDVLIVLVLLVGACTLGSQIANGAPSEAELVALRDGFDARRDAMVELLKGKPLKAARKRPPLGPGRAAYTRHYSYSIMSFAMKALWLDEYVDEANAALVENFRYYIGNRQARLDRDSFYWPADVLCRLVELFGQKGTRASGRMTTETEAVALEMMWLYCQDNSRLANADWKGNKTWHIWESENHHIQGFSTVWHFLRFLGDTLEYRARELADGANAGQHYAAWTDYCKEYLRERVRKGLFVEMANKGYGVMTLKGIYNFHDFADDPELRRLARCVLDLYWATWAEEQIDGVRGGGASRVYQGPMSQFRDGDGIGRLAGFYFGRGTDKAPRDNELTVLTSTYRMPLVVMDLALDTEGRGVYEIRQRRLGLVEEGYYKPKDYRMLTDNGGIVRYSYCTPELIIGTAMLEARPFEDWAMISSQNRWHGVIFAGHEDARIFPQCQSKKTTYNQQWSVQRKGTLIAQKLRGSKKAGAMRVWFSKPGLTNRVERDGWVFVESKGAYAAVRPAQGGHTWAAAGPKARGQWLRCRDEWAPVIIDVARKATADSYESFQESVVAAELRIENRVLTYRGIGGDAFTFYVDQRKSPEVTGEPVDYAPPLVFDSPFIRSEWDSGRVVLRKGTRTLVIDVNEQ